MFGLFSKKAERKEVEQIKEAVQTGFNSVKHDIGNLTKWIKHLDSEDNDIKNEILDLQEGISTIKDELENLKNMLDIVGNRGLFKQTPTVFNKQTAVGSVLNTVQTGVQTAFLDNLTTNERAIVFVLLNSDMKLSYEDLAAMLGKRKSTIRGQVNSIRQKSEGLIHEVIGENNKKRIFIPEGAKEMLMKTRKVRNGREKG